MSMFLLIAAMASTGLAPEAINPAGWFSSDTFPPQALKDGTTGRTRFQVIVSSQGKIIKCDVIASSGNGDLDLTTCIDAFRFGKLNPGHDLLGQPLLGIYRNWVFWDPMYPKRLPPKPPKTDFDIALRQIPAAVANHPYVQTDIIVAADGAIESCTPIKSPAADILGKVACQQVMEHWKPTIAIDDHNEKQRSVQRLDVGFTDPSHPSN